MGKGNASKPKGSKGAKPALKDASAKTAAASDALRQAIKDLGGDDSDLDLIAGVDSDDENEAAPKAKGKVDDVSGGALLS